MRSTLGLGPWAVELRTSRVDLGRAHVHKYISRLRVPQLEPVHVMSSIKAAKISTAPFRYELLRGKSVSHPSGGAIVVETHRIPTKSACRRWDMWRDDTLRAIERAEIVQGEEERS